MPKLFHLLLLLLLPHSLSAGPRDLVVVRPGGPSTSEEATRQVSRLIVEIARRAGWEETLVQATYFNRADDAVAHIANNPPGFLLTSPGFFLEHRTALKLEPINQILINNRNTHRYYIVVRKDTFTNLSDLQGSILAGAALAEPDFVERVVLERRFDFGTNLKVEHRRALSALRKLRQGELDAVILDEMEHTSLEQLPFAGELTTIFASAPVPNTGIFALEEVAAEGDAEALAVATENFCKMGEGSAICETYGISGFKQVRPDLFDDLIRQFDEPAGRE
jgi:hypothetical protein